MSIKLPIALLVAATAVGGWWAQQRPTGPQSSLDAPLRRPMITLPTPATTPETDGELDEAIPTSIAAAKPSAPVS